MNKMLARAVKLLSRNKETPRAFRVEKAGDNEATIYLYDVIGYDWWSGGGITALDFAKELAALGDKTLHLRFNSPGGDVFEGRAIVAALNAYRGKVVGHIDGLAASAASFIAVHCDELEITDGAFVMIHNGWTLAMGDRHAMTECAALLEKIDGSIVDDYLTRMSIERGEIAAMMDAETWFTASEAVANGFADRLAAKDEKADANAKAAVTGWDLSAFGHAPAAALRAIARVASAPATPDPETPDPAPLDNSQQHAHNLRALALSEAAA